MLVAMSKAPLLIVCALAVLGVVCASQDVVFYDGFTQSLEGRWISSVDEAYGGKMKYAKSEGHDEYGLLVSEPAKKYGISALFDEAVDPMASNDKPLVLQYELRLQNGLECGGAYIKYLMPAEGWKPMELKDSTPYSIMFGPDKCGSTNKVHFIFRHKSPKTGEYIEHHLSSPPTPVGDKFTHVYTAIIYPNNTLQILIDGTVKKTADLLSSDFAPAVIPPKTISDPDDKKPEDWDERAKIPDPESTKPEDWDEDASREIEDADAKKPDGWLDDEPLEADDPEAIKPSDWDEEEDGAWEPPRVPNPKCTEGPGCGEWKRPMKANPAYKGKWSAPLIDNPAYKGIWKPRDIANPDYFELSRPRVEPIAAAAVEIWTMQDGMHFGNVLVATSSAVAEELRKEKWEPKSVKEKEQQAKDDAEKEKAAPKSMDLKDKIFQQFRKIADIPALKAYRSQILSYVDLAEKEYPMSTFALLIGAFTIFVAIIYSLLPGKKAAPRKIPVEVAKKEDITEEDDEGEEEDEDAGKDEIQEAAEGKDDDEGVAKRRTRRRDG